MRLLSVFLGLFLLLVIVSLAWRSASKRFQLPCPTWLAWGLENPLLLWLLGTSSTLERLNLKPGQRILEIGPGPGRLLLPAASRVLPGGEAVGVDIQAGMVERLLAAARGRGLDNVRGVVADATTMDLPATTFDLVFIALTLGEIPRRQAALERAFHVLKPGGRLAITELFPDPHFVPRGTVRALAAAAGFTHLSTVGNAAYFTATFEKPGRHQNPHSA